jgi:hypothetical protein
VKFVRVKVEGGKNSMKKELIFMELISDFLQTEYKVDRAEALAQSCVILDKIKEKGLEIK